MLQQDASKLKSITPNDTAVETAIKKQTAASILCSLQN